MKVFLKKFFDISFLKFILVGIVNTLVGTGVMFAFYNIFHFGYWISSASNYIVGSIVSYFLNKYFTFRSKDNSTKSILRFIVNITICYIAAYGIAQPLVRLIFSSFSTTIQDNISMLAGMGLFIILNYVGQRFFVFTKTAAK